MILTLGRLREFMASLGDTIKLYLKGEKERKERRKKGREGGMNRGRTGGRKTLALERLTVEWFQLFGMNTVFLSTRDRWLMAF